MCFLSWKLGGAKTCPRFATMILQHSKLLIGGAVSGFVSSGWAAWAGLGKMPGQSRSKMLCIAPKITTYHGEYCTPHSEHIRQHSGLSITAVQLSRSMHRCSCT